MKAGAEVKPEFLRQEGLRLLLFGGKGGVGKTTCAMVVPPSSCPTCSALRRPEEPLLGRYDAACAGRRVALVFRQEEPRGSTGCARSAGPSMWLQAYPIFHRQQRRLQWNLAGILS